MSIYYKDYIKEKDILKKADKFNLYLCIFISFISFAFIATIEEDFPISFFFVIALSIYGVYTIFEYFLKNIYFLKEIGNSAKEVNDHDFGSQYKILIIRKNGMTTETRYFENNVLSNHKSQAIIYNSQDPWKKSNKNAYYYKGKLIEANDNNDFIKIIKSIKTISNFS